MGGAAPTGAPLVMGSIGNEEHSFIFIFQT
jgi:hypothetical protein